MAKKMIISVHQFGLDETAIWQSLEAELEKTLSPCLTSTTLLLHRLLISRTTGQAERAKINCVTRNFTTLTLTALVHAPQVQC